MGAAADSPSKPDAAVADGAEEAPVASSSTPLAAAATAVRAVDLADAKVWVGGSDGRIRLYELSEHDEDDEDGAGGRALSPSRGAGSLGGASTALRTPGIPGSGQVSAACALTLKNFEAAPRPRELTPPPKVTPLHLLEEAHTPAKKPADSIAFLSRLGLVAVLSGSSIDDTSALARPLTCSHRGHLDLSLSFNPRAFVCAPLPELARRHVLLAGPLGAHLFV